MQKFVPFISLLLFLSCGDEPALPIDSNMLVIPEGFPELVFPQDNEFTEARWELGKRLFFDPILSRDGSISCASCHHPDLAFSEDRPFSAGIEERIGTRNAPTLANVGYHPYLTREGGVPTLEMQVLVPIQEHKEFDFNILSIADRLKEDSSYIASSREAYGREPDAFVITRSISCFERTIISGNSRYDKFLRKKIAGLTDSEMRGKELFFSDHLACAQCHSGFNFTNYTFENNGLYDVYIDLGRFLLTGDDKDIALFKVPTLRNVAVTSPYMHDGSISNLMDVVEHYNTGGHNHPHKSQLLKPLNLTTQNKIDLVAFLGSLTDYDFLSDPKFKK